MSQQHAGEPDADSISSTWKPTLSTFLGSCLQFQNLFCRLASKKGRFYFINCRHVSYTFAVAHFPSPPCSNYHDYRGFTPSEIWHIVASQSLQKIFLAIFFKVQNTNIHLSFVPALYMKNNCNNQALPCPLPTLLPSSLL